MALERKRMAWSREWPSSAGGGTGAAAGLRI